MATTSGGEMHRDEVGAWVARYEQQWRAGEAARLEEIFTEDVAYLRSPYEEPLGLAALGEVWADPTPFSMTAGVVAVQGSEAVVRVEVHYRGARPQEYRDLWVISFAADGRARRFEEWAYWPDKAYSASAPDGVPDDAPRP